ncbi:MAG: holo-ACP synthase [Thermomicrobium sp.]|nr:holo-ACP synthase [Thermomicrobium sp.]MDW8058974.1 holo-ACP synthase [Thermomicrobium sp.]
MVIEPLWDPDAAGPVEVGVDAIEIQRIQRVVQRFGQRFLERIYTEAERSRYAGRIPELAARFAAKEAVMKALGTGIRGIRWRDIEVLPNARGKPLIRLYGTAAERARRLGVRHIAVSLTHARELAIAVVVATFDASGPGRP